MRREFDLNTWKTKGRYHYDPVSTSSLYADEKTGAVAVNHLKEAVDHSRKQAEQAEHIIYPFRERTCPPNMGTSALSKRGQSHPPAAD
jgi:hypothetical protein